MTSAVAPAGLRAIAPPVGRPARAAAPARAAGRGDMASARRPAPASSLAARQRRHLDRSLLVGMLGGGAAMAACAGLAAAGVLAWAAPAVVLAGGIVALATGGSMMAFGMPRA